MTVDLYSPADIKKVRQELLKEQNYKCKLTDLPITLADSHTDHAHDSEQLVRGALHRHANLTLGKLEGLWTRYLSFWYPHDLPTFLRQAATYLELPRDTRYRHSGWIRRLTLQFNTLTAKQQQQVIQQLGSTECCTNATQRKKVFSKLLKNRILGYTKILAAINQSKS